MLLIESSELKPIIEGVDSEKKLYIEGIMVSADIVNRNKRVYPKSVVESAINTYRTNYISRNKAGLELSHPNSQEINPDRVAARLLYINESDKNYIGRALVVDTPCGRTVKGLIEGGFDLGFSSRGQGTVKVTESGVGVVQEDLVYSAIDIVWNQSAPDAMVSAIMESTSPFWNTVEEYADANLIESFQKEMKGLTTLQISENKLRLFEKFVQLIKVKS